MNKERAFARIKNKQKYMVFQNLGDLIHFHASPMMEMRLHVVFTWVSFLVLVLSSELDVWLCITSLHEKAKSKQLVSFLYRELLLLSDTTNVTMCILLPDSSNFLRNSYSV